MSEHEQQKEPPKVLTGDTMREIARAMRDSQWKTADHIAERGTLWICWWNKNRHHMPPYPDDLKVCGLIDGMELLEWFGSHEDWWEIGKWSDKRYAAPVSITEAGRAALAQRHLYDMEPVTGGLVEPGWICTPAEKPNP